jgi:hypothetical protein
LESHLDEYGLSREEAAFLQAVVKAMNRELEGYDLTESMTGSIKQQYDVDEQSLCEQGYLKRHQMGPRVYYTVTRQGQEACGIEKKQGLGIGDFAAETPHRVGSELAARYYESMPDVHVVSTSLRSRGSVLDLQAITAEGDVAAVGEIEAGRVTADGELRRGESPGINDYASIRADAEKLAQYDGDSVWVVRNYEIAGTVLRALVADNLIDIQPDVIERVEDAQMMIQTLQENHVSTVEHDGLDKIVTFRQLRNWLADSD